LEFKELIKEAYYYNKSGMLFAGNCLKWLKEFPSNSIDLIWDLYTMLAKNPIL
jgi:DNA modification methylase